MDHHEWADAQTETTVTVDRHDLQYAVYEAGEANEGPPVVFLHGIPTWSYLWRDAAPALAESRHVIAPDLVGYGNSANRDGFDRSVRAQTVALADFLAEHAEEDADFVAHDIGGAVALRYAAARPDAVERMVLSNAACFDSWPVEFINSLGVPGEAEGWDDDELDEKLAFLFDDGVYDDADPEWLEGLKAPWRREGGRTALARAAVSTNTNHTTEIDYGSITADLLCLWGGDDVLQPAENGERLVDAVAGDGEVVALDRAYHWVTQDRPDAYRERLVEFLG